MMQAKNSKEKSVGEHFTFFLAKNGHLNDEYSINKKKLRDVFISEYLAMHHVHAEPWKLMGMLSRANCIDRSRKPKKTANSSSEEIVTFKAEKVQEIIASYGKKSEEAALDKSLGAPIIKVYVTQQHAFQTKLKKNPGFTETECKLCHKQLSNAADYEDHKNLELHQIRETYRLDRRRLNTNQNILVQAGLETDVASEEIILRENSLGSLPIQITNTSKMQHYLVKIFVLYELREVVERWPILPLQLKPGSTISFPMEFEFRHTGAYIYPLVLKLCINNNISYVLKELIFRIQSEFLDDLKPTSPYTKPIKPVLRHSEAPLVYGEPLPIIPTLLATERPLGHFPLPQALRRIINHGLKEFNNMPEIDVKKLQEVKSLLELGSAVQVTQLLNKEKYSNFFSLLLYFEEHQMSVDIRMYDSDDRTMQEVKEDRKLLSLKVPGLSENRPSVLRGDRVHVTIQGDESVKYEGNVHKVLESEVWLGFNRSLRQKFIPEMKFHVEYTINRLPLRVQHRALKMINDHGVSHILFPTQHSVNTVKTNVMTWFNKKLAGNPEQQQAVRNIVSGTAYPAPYLIFGPPGTGKTVTVCEAITQLYYLKPNGHILVCTPSNSAADEITKRLLSTSQGNIPESAIFRLYAASRSPIAIPPELKKCCNFEGEFFYPPKNDIMKYRIVVVTLMTVGRLVSGGISAGHFSHLFIDESGQAVEPETLIPLAGLFTSDEQKGKLYGHLVLAGDPKQLGPILRSTVAIKLGLGTSLLERLMLHCDLYKRTEDQNRYNPLVLTKLVQNFRSHEKILTLPDKLFYDNELKSCGDPAMTNLACNWDGLPTPGFPIIFHGVKGKDQREGNSPSYFNLQEIDIAAKYVEKILDDKFCGRKLKPSDIGIITPYKKQGEKIRKLFKKKKWEGFDVGSVEEFQGQERIVIIISTVRSTMELLEEDYKFHLGFLKNPKRFNVALTRAKALLIIVGDPNVLQCDANWRELIVFCKDHQSYKGCPFNLTNIPMPIEDLTFNLSSLKIESIDNKSADGPQWRGDI